MKVKVKVIWLDSQKISLSIKRLKENPWDVLSKKHKLNDIVTAPISRISKFGAFMDLDCWIQGLIHLSEISHEVVTDIRDYIKVWEEVKAKIINFEPTKKRIGLSLKALQDNPNKDVKKKPTKNIVKKELNVSPKKWVKSEEDKIDEELAGTKPTTKKETVKKTATVKKTTAKKETVKKTTTKKEEVKK
jgi:ribosomal protein S1